MKLGELKAAIRSRKGNPSVTAMIAGREAQVTVQKASIMETLDIMFEKARNAETGLYLNDDGMLVQEGEVSAASVSYTGVTTQEQAEVIGRAKFPETFALIDELSLDDDLDLDDEPAVIDDLDDL